MSVKKWSWGSGLWDSLKSSTNHWTIISLIFTIGVMGFSLGWITAAVLFVGIAWHELGHVLALRRYGIPVAPTIFLPFFGGMARAKGWVNDAKQETEVALAGPCFGLMFAFLLEVLALIFDRDWLQEAAMIQAAVNIFNLLPLYPMDGGRVAKAISRSFPPIVGNILMIMGLVLAVSLSLLLRAPVLLLMAYLGFREWRMEKRVMKQREILETFAAVPLPPELSSDLRELLAALVPLAKPPVGMSKRNVLLSVITYHALAGALFLVLIGSLLLKVS